MPKFTVLRRVDAFVDYTAEVEAVSAGDAAEKANVAPLDYTWHKQGGQEFDAQLFVALDASGKELEATQCGDF